MWTHSIKLMSSNEVTYDDDGFPIESSEWLEHIPANYTDLTRQDRELANQLGYDAEVNVQIMSCNYSGQRSLVDEETGETLYVQRTYKPDRGDLVTLTCGRRERHGGI